MRWLGIVLGLSLSVLATKPSEDQPPHPLVATPVATYTPLQTSVRWLATGATSRASAIAAVGARERLYVFQVANDGQLTVTSIGPAGMLTGAVGLGGVSADALVTGFDAFSSHVIVAVRTTANRIVVGESVADPTGLGPFMFQDVGATTASPSLAVGCGRSWVALRASGAIWVRSAAAGGGAWTPPQRLFAASGAPVLASAPGRIGLAVRGTTRVSFAQLPCGQARWSTPITIGDRGISDDRIGLAAYGTLFAISVRGNDLMPYFMLQTGLWNNPQWPQRFERVDASPRTAPTTVLDTPVVSVFRGILILTSRGPDRATRYWIRDPNRLGVSTTPWLGGRIVGGTGTASTPPAVSAAQTNQLSGLFARQTAPSELFLVTTGINDRRVYLINLGRFMTLDVLEGVYAMTINTQHSSGGIAKEKVPNLVENLMTFLRTSPGFREQLSNIQNADALPGLCPNGDRLGISIYPNAGRGEYVDGGCDPWPSGVVVENTGTSWRLFEEYGHRVLDTNQSMMSGNFLNIFGAIGNDALRRCSVDTDCGTGETCRAVDSGSGLTPGNVCKVPWRGGYRARGFIFDYQANSLHHNWIYTALLYRWFGDELRDMAAADRAAGDPRLQAKYDYVRAQFWTGVEFSGRLDQSSDENEALIAVPNR